MTRAPSDNSGKDRTATDHGGVPHSPRSDGRGKEPTDLDRQRQRKAEVRGVIAMAIPMVITMSSRAVMDVADYTMVTWLRVDAAQAAILPAQIIMWSYIILGLGIASMINTFASQTLGRKQYRECSKYAWQILYIAAFFGVVAIVARPWLPSLIGLFNHAPEVQALELAYSHVALLTVAPTIIAYGLGWFFVGIHRPWVTMWSAIEANIINVIVSYILIFGHFGIEPMGIAGAAWGTLAAVSFRSIRLILTLLTPSMAQQYGTRTTWVPSWRYIRELSRVGMPFSLQMLCEVVVWAIFVNALIGSRYPTEHLIATSTVWQYMRIAFLPTFGVGQALTALVGKSIGANEPEQAMRETRIAVWITLAYMGSLSLVYGLFGGTLVSWFNDDPEVVAIGRNIMICAAFFLLFDAIGITYGSALRGAGETFIPSVFSMVSHWLIVVGGGWLAAIWFPKLSSMGPWIAASGLIVLNGLFLWWRWNCRAWMKIDLFGSKPNSTVDSPSATADVSNPTSG